MQAHARLGAVASDESFDCAVTQHERRCPGAHACRATGADNCRLYERDTLVLERRDAAGEPFADHFDPSVPPPWEI
jgi:hypothetical protein